MRVDTPPVAAMMDLAASTLPLLDRARGLVQNLDRWLRADAIWLTLCDARSDVYATVGRSGLERPVLDYLGEQPTRSDRPGPPGVRRALDLPLREPGGPHVGMLELLLADDGPGPAGVRSRLAELAPLLARGISPTRSMLATARLVDGAASGIVVMRNGTTYPLPGLADDQAPQADPAVIALARRALLAHQVYRTFLWPIHGTAGHSRMTVLAATDAPDFVLGMVLVTPDADCRGLTARELEVLGLVVEGCSNQQIAGRLSIALRTVATHVENILHKLDVPTRTVAAVRAEREGCYVPP